MRLTRVALGFTSIYMIFSGSKNHIFCVLPSRMDIFRRIYAAAEPLTPSELGDSSFCESKPSRNRP